MTKIVYHDATKYLHGVEIVKGLTTKSVFDSYGPDEYPAFNPEYAIVKSVNGYLYVATCATLYDSTSRLYQPICAVENMNDEIIAAAGVYYETAARAYRAVIVDGVVYRAPVILELRSGDKVIARIPMGIAPAVAVALVLFGIGAATASIAYLVKSFKDPGDAKKAVYDAIAEQIKKCDSPQCVAMLLDSLNAPIVEADINASSKTDDWLEGATKFLTQFKDVILGVGGMMATIYVLIKLHILQTVLDMIRSLVRRR